MKHDQLLSTLRSVGAPPPVLGFGISTPEHVRQALNAGAAGVISGSAIVRLANEKGADAVRDFVREMKSATVIARSEATKQSSF